MYNFRQTVGDFFWFGWSKFRVYAILYSLMQVLLKALALGCGVNYPNCYFTSSNSKILTTSRRVFLNLEVTIDEFKTYFDYFIQLFLFSF